MPVAGTVPDGIQPQPRQLPVEVVAGGGQALFHLLRVGNRFVSLRFGDGAGGGGSGSGRGGGASRGSGGVVPSPASGRRPWAGRRLVGFVQGSWRELQRVQWPDRRQVMQATGVVIGFVIVAGVFLGVADFVATKVVNLILK